MICPTCVYPSGPQQQQSIVKKKKNGMGRTGGTEDRQSTVVEKGCGMCMPPHIPQPGYKAIPQMWHRNKRAKGPHKGSILKVSATNHFATTVSIGAGKRAGDASGWTQDPGPKRAIASGRPPRRMCANAMHEPFHDDKNAVSRFGQSAKRQRGNGDGDPRSRRSEFMRKDRHGIPEDKNTHIVDRTRLGIYMKRKEAQERERSGTGKSTGNLLSFELCVRVVAFSSQRL
jgi:hypothetical protein